MNIRKLLSVCGFLTVLVLFACTLSVSSFAAGKASTTVDNATEEVVSQATPADLTNPDTYVKLAEMAKDWGMANGPHILMALVVFVVGRMIAKWVTNMSRRGFQKAKVEQTLCGFLCKMIYYALMTGVVISAAGELGIQTTSFLAILGAAGLAIGLALKDSLSNFASGVLLIIFRPFTVGDFVTAGGVTGTVKQIDIFSTIIYTPDNKKQIIPNAGITADVITNVNAEPTRRIDLVIGIGYDDDIRLAKMTLEDLIKADARILTDPAPFIGVAELGDSSVNLNVRPWVKSEEYRDVRADFTEAIKLSFDEKGISFPYPQQDVHMYQSAKH